MLIGVDGGADALRAAGHRPDLVVGDLDAVSDEVLRSGAEVVVRAHPDGRAPGLERVQDLGVAAVTFPATGTSEDLALLLADAHGAALVVTVGSHATLLEFLDRGRAGTASTFLTRLRLGGKLVDAKAVSQFAHARISAGALLLLVAAALVAVGGTLVLSTPGRAYLGVVAGWWTASISWVRGLLG